MKLTDRIPILYLERELRKLYPDEQATQIINRITFDYGYYQQGVERKRIKRLLFYCNHVMKFSINRHIRHCRMRSMDINNLINILWPKHFNNK